MAKLGTSLQGRLARQTTRPKTTTPTPVEENQVERRYSNVAPVTGALAQDTYQTTRQQAIEQMLKLDELGLGDTPEFARAAEIAERGAVDPQGKVAKIAGALDWLDRPGHLLRAFTADIFGADKGSEIKGGDYWSIIKGDYETLAERHGGLFGEDGRLVGGEILDAFNWETEAGDTNWFNNALHGVAGFALDVGLDPLTYVTGGAGGALKKTLLTGANTAVERGVVRGAAMQLGEKAGTKAAREGSEKLAEEAAKRISLKTAALDSVDELTEKAIREEVQNEMLAEVIQPLAKKRFDQLPQWWKEDTDIVGDWMKGGIRFGFGSRNKYGGTGGLIAGKPAQAREVLGNQIRKVPGTGAQLDKLAKARGKIMGNLNVFDPVIQGAKQGYDWAPKAVQLMADSVGEGAAKHTRAIQIKAGQAMSKMANRLSDESANPEEMAELFTNVFRWTQDGNLIDLNEADAAMKPALREAGAEFVQEWQEVTESLRREAVDVGILPENRALQDYVPAVTSQEFRDLARETADTGLATWDDDAPEELKEGLAWLNEMIQGIHRRVRGDQKVAGATVHANERTIGRGVEVIETGESFLFQFTDQVGPKYAGHAEMNAKMIAALDWVIDKHNRQYGKDPLRRITKPKWLEEAVELGDTARQGVMEMDPARVLQTYVRGMSQAINERRITQMAEEVGLLSKNELSLDAAKVAYRIHEQFEGIVNTTQKRLAKRVEKLASEQGKLTELAERTPPPRSMVKVKLGDDVEVSVPRKALDDPVVQERIKAAKTKLKAQRDARSSRDRAHENRVRRLKNVGVSDEVAEQFADAGDQEIREIYRAVYMWQRVKIAEEMGINFEILRTGIDNSMEDFRVHDKALNYHRDYTARLVREVEESRLSMQRQWRRRQQGPRRIRFDTHADRQALQDTFRQGFAGEVQLLSELLGPMYRTDLERIATEIQRGNFKEAKKLLELFSDHTFSDGSEWTAEQVRKLRKSTNGKKRKLWDAHVPKGYSAEKYDELHSYIESRRYESPDGLTVPEGYRDMWEGMKEIEAEEMAAAAALDEIHGPLMNVRGQFDTFLWFMEKIEKGDTITSPSARKYLLQLLRKEGLLKPNQAIEWTKSAPYGFQIRDMNSWTPLPLRRVEREIKDAGFSHVDQARRAVDIASMTEEEWMTYQASALGAMGVDAQHIVWGIDTSDAAERIAANWHGQMKHYWDFPNPQVMQEWPLEDGAVLRWERNGYHGFDVDDAIVWRDENGELLGYIMASPRVKPALKESGTDDLMNGVVNVGIAPEANAARLINGVRPIKAMREKAEEAFLPTFVGTGQSGYKYEGALSAWKAAKKMTEGFSDDVKESLLRLGDDYSAQTYTVAERELREARRILRNMEDDHVEYAAKAARFQRMEETMEEIRKELNKRIDPMRTKPQPRTALNWAKIDTQLDELLVEANRLRLGPHAQRAVMAFQEEVERIRGLESDITAWLGGRAQEAATLRATYFDGDAAAVGIRDLVNLQENAVLNAGLDQYGEAIDTMGQLSDRIAQILGYVDGPEGPQITRYLDAEQAEQLESLVAEARRLWNDTVGVEGNPFTDVNQLYTPAPTRPGWAPSAAVNLAGEGVTGYGGDAQAMQFLDNLIGKHIALGPPEGFKEITGSWQQALNWWKTYATVVRAPFHARNFISAMWANQIADVRLQDYAGAAKLFTNGKDSFFWKLMVRGEGIESALSEVKDPRVRAAAQAAYDEGMFFETFAEQEIASKIISRNKGGSVGKRAVREALSTEGTVARAGGHAMQSVESYHRFAAFLRMYEPEVPGSARDALSWVHTIHFDYSDLTSFERDFIKKYVPFYVWAKNNIPLQLRLIVERPGIINRYGHLIREVDNGWGGEDDPNLPGSSWRNTPYAKFGDLTGGADDFYTQMVFAPDVPVADLYDFGITLPSMIAYMANSLGPQFDLLKETGADYQVSAPGSMNMVLNALGKVGLFNESQTGLNRVSPIARGLWSTAMPFGADYIDPLVEKDPARLERLGQAGGVEGSTPLDSLKRLGMKNVAGGLGLIGEGGEAAYRASVGASFDLQEDYTGLRKTGFVDPELETAIGPGAKTRAQEIMDELFPSG